MNKLFVYDGDTVHQGHERYRIEGVDTFELNALGGVQARDATRRMMDAGFQLEPVEGGSGGYGRRLGQLKRDGDVSGQQALVNAGLGNALPPHMNETVNPFQNLHREITGTVPAADSIENDLTFRRLADEARSARLERLNQVLANPAKHLGHMRALPTADDPAEQRGHFKRGVLRGTDTMQATFYGFANALGRAAGIDALAEWGEQGVAENILEAMRNPATVGSWEDIDGLADAGVYAIEAVAEFMPQLLVDGTVALASGAAAATGVGAPAAAGLVLTRQSLAGIGKSILRRAGAGAVPNARTVAANGISRSELFKEGARLGAFGSMYMQSAGESQMNFAAEGIDNPGGALALGAAKAALDLYGFEKILSQTFEGLSKDALAPANIRELLSNAVKASSIGFTAEGVTEATQALIDEMSIAAQKPDYDIEWATVIDGFLKGGIGAGAVTGAGRLGVDTMRMMGTAGLESQPVEVPGADDPLQDTLPEPERDIRAQLSATPQGEARWFTSDNSEQAKAAAQKLGIPVRDTPDGGVVVAEQSVLDSLPDNPTQADISRAMGYAQTKDEALADPQGTVVVETRDQSGAVLRNQLVGASIAEAVRRQQAEKFPDAETVIAPVRESILRREQALAEEGWKPKGLLNQRSAQELVEEATALGIDTQRFQRTGFGQALIDRITGGLKAVTGPNPHKRLNSLEPISELLDLDPAALRAETYGKDRIVVARQRLLDAFEERVREKYGSVGKFAETLDFLPRNEVRRIGEALGVAQEGGFDIGGLVSEIEARRSETQRESDLATLESREGRLMDELQLIRDAQNLAQLEQEAQRLEAEQLELEANAPEHPGLREMHFSQAGNPGVQAATLRRRIERVRTSDPQQLTPQRLAQLERQLQPAELPPTVQPAKSREELLAERGRAAEVLRTLTQGLEAARAGSGEISSRFDVSTLQRGAERARSELRRLDNEIAKLDALTPITDSEVIQRAIRDEHGNLLTGDELESRIEQMDRRERNLVVEAVEALGIGTGGANRTGFIAMLRAALAPEQTTSAAVDVTQASELADPEVQTIEAVEFDPSALDSEGARFVDLVEQTPLSDRAADGWPSGAVLYLDAIARIEQAAESTPPVAAVARQRLRYGAALSHVLRGLEGAVDGFNASEFHELVVRLVGLTEGDTSLAVGRDLDPVVALRWVADREDGRVAQALATIMGRRFAPELSDREVKEALADAVRENPEETLREGLNYLRSIYGEEGPERMGLILMYEGWLDAERGRDRPVTATSRGRDAGVGDGIAVDASVTGNEQVMSDASFARGLRHISIAHWPVAILPDADQLPHVKFGYSHQGNSVAQANTERAKGKNLLAIPKEEGAFGGSVVDAISLAAYAQGGERAPQNVTEAATNLMANISRMMLGPQNSEVVGEPWGFVRSLPDDLVIYLNRESGEPETFGQAMSIMSRSKEAEDRRAALTREVDALADEADALEASLLDALNGQVADRIQAMLANQSSRTRGYFARALAHWERMLSGEKVVVNGRRVYERRPLGLSDKPLRDAVDAIGRIPLKVEVARADGKTQVQTTNLSDLHSELLTLRGRLGEKVAERKRLDTERLERLDNDRDEIDAALDQLARDWGIERHELDPDAPGVPQAIEQIMRGREGTVENELGNRLIEESPESDVLPPTISDALEQQPSEARRTAEQRMRERQAAPVEIIAHQAALEAWDKAAAEASEAGLAGFYGLNSTVKSSRSGKGMTLAEVERIAADYLASLGGNIQLDFRISQTQEELYGPLREDTAGQPIYIKGAYHPATEGRRSAALSESLPKGLVTLVADNLTDAEDVVATLRHEILGHFGLNTFPPEIKRQVLDAIQKSKTIPGMRSLWADIERRYAESSEDVKAEEVYALVVEQPDYQPALLERILNWLALALRRIGLLKGTVTRPELQAMAEQIAGAIRDGRARQRTWPKTEAESFRQFVPGQAMLGARAKSFWKSGRGFAAPVMSMVYSRIARYSPELSRLLFQPTNAASSSHGQSWQQRARALEGRMMGQVDKLLSGLREELHGSAALRDQQIQSYFVDAYSSAPRTEQGRQIRALVDSLTAEAKQAGLRSVDFPGGFAPVAFDRRAVDARRGEFESLLQSKLIKGDGSAYSRIEIAEIVRNILDGPGVLEGVIAPGMPVGLHQNTRAIIDDLGMDALINGGWLLDRHEAALIHWVSGVSKRASWEAIFGEEDITRYGWRDGKQVAGFSPNGKFHRLLDEVRQTHGEQAAEEILVLVNGALGRHPAGQSMPGWWRTTQEFITGWVGMTVLAFSGIASIPEFGLPFVRAGGRVGVGEIISSFGEAKRLAQDLGIVLSDASEQVVWQMTGEQYRSPAISKMQSLFFKYNGNALIVKYSRILATGLATRFLLNAAAANDTASLNKLNIDAGTILAWDQAGRPAWSPHLDPATAQIARAVADSINQFVNEATLNPSRFQATGWGNNPWMKMIWHLKHFLYTYGDTVLGGIYREMRSRWKHLNPSDFNDALAVAAPAILFGVAVMPLAAASLEARDWIRRLNGRRSTEYEDSISYLSDVFNRAGGLGPVDFLLSMREQQEWGRSVWGTLAPVPGKVDTLFGSGSAESKVRQLIPIWSQNKGLPLPWE